MYGKCPKILHTHFFGIHVAFNEIANSVDPD